jgi:hypothetical protein
MHVHIQNQPMYGTLRIARAASTQATADWQRATLLGSCGSLRVWRPLLVPSAKYTAHRASHLLCQHACSARLGLDRPGR